MSIYISEYEQQIKQYVNLSDYAWTIINNDILAFSINNKKDISLSGFLNTIIRNFYNDSSASISQRLIQKEDTYKDLINEEEDAATKKGMIALRDQILKSYEKELIHQNLTYPIGKGIRFSINKENMEILRNLDEDIGKADCSLGKFLKIIFEEYARLSSAEREQIILKDLVDIFALACERGCGLKMILNPKEKEERRIFRVRPYKIVADSEKTHAYLVGLSHEITNGMPKTKEEPHGTRLTSIERLIPLSTQSDFISKEQKEKLENTCKRPQYTKEEDDIIITVKLTDQGLNLLRSINKNRPLLVGQKSKYVYQFKGNTFQIQHYFWRFGPDVEVVSPEAIRNIYKEWADKISSLYKEKTNS